MIKIKNVVFNNSNESNDDIQEILSTVQYIKNHLLYKDKDELVEELNADNEEFFKEKKPVNVVKYAVDLDDESDVSYIEEQMINVLKYIANNKVKLQSNFSRYNALLVAACASQGFITNIDEDGQIVNYWKLTLEGILELKRVGD